MMAGGMEAKYDSGADWKVYAEALRPDRNTTVGSDFKGGAKAPNIRPPRAARDWTQDGAFFFQGEIPGVLWGQFQLAVDFVCVAMESQRIDVWVGRFHIADEFAGKIGRKPDLPELVSSLHFSFGLRRWSIKETNVVELECPAELGQSLGIPVEKNGVIIDVDLEGSSMVEESGG